jgi:hypothetical protein
VIVTNLFIPAAFAGPPKMTPKVREFRYPGDAPREPCVTGSLSGNNPLPHPHRANDEINEDGEFEDSQSVMTFLRIVIPLYFFV